MKDCMCLLIHLKVAEKGGVVMVTEVIHLKVEVVVWLNRCILRWFHHMYQKDHPMRSI